MFWSEIVKKTLINTTFALFSVHFLLKTLYFSLFYYSTGHVRPRSMRKRRVRQFEFLTGISTEWFFHSWYTPKEHVFRDPNTFSNLHEAFSSVSRFVLIQRWTALIQRKPALNSSETALISAGFLNPFWNSAVQRWFALGLQPGSINSSFSNILHAAWRMFTDNFGELTAKYNAFSAFNEIPSGPFQGQRAKRWTQLNSRWKELLKRVCW